MTKEDYVIICGDFGGVWNKEVENKEEKHLLDWLEEKPFTTCSWMEIMKILTGFTAIQWNCGMEARCIRSRPSVIHLMRGQIYEIDGKSFFTFGGASSHDIESAY